MIPESIIEQQIARRTTANFDADLKAFSSAQPYLADYLSGEDTAAFIPAEQELLYFAVFVIYGSIEEHYGTPGVVKGDDIAALEEDNFVRLQEQQSRGFRARLDVFFQETEEEDLLAFIEDMLTPDEESVVTKEGREPLFVILKTCMDALL